MDDRSEKLISRNGVVVTFCISVAAASLAMACWLSWKYSTSQAFFESCSAQNDALIAQAKAANNERAHLSLENSRLEARIEDLSAMNGLMVVELNDMASRCSKGGQKRPQEPESPAAKPRRPAPKGSGHIVAEDEPAPEASQTLNAETMLDAHNRYRSAVGVQPLKWSPILADRAGVLAALIARDRCSLDDAPAGEGRNLFKSRGGSYTDAAVVDYLAQAAPKYDRATGECAPGTMPGACGTYTQVVWRDTKEVGCAAAACAGEKAQIWACMYSPPGNVSGEKAF